MIPKDGVYEEWLKSGEIDIMGYGGQEPPIMMSTIYYGNDWQDKGVIQIRSVVMVAGQPKRDTHPRMNAFATVSALISNKPFCVFE
jgi:hypothetical protein